MSKQTLRTMMIISGLMVVSAITAHAQAGSSFMVSVPFDFTVSGRTLAAGEYIVARNGVSSDGLTIRSKDGKGGASALTKTIQTEDIQNETTVVFKRYDDQFFLSQVWVSGRSTGREIYKSKQERTVERELARRAVKPTTIAIVGQAK